MWSTATKTSLDLLQALQNRALRAIGNIQLNEDITPYYTEYKILDVRKTLTYKLFIEILRQYSSDSRFLLKYQIKECRYELRKTLLTKPRSRTNYGDQKLSHKILHVLNEHPVILEVLISGTTPSQYKKFIKPLLFSIV